VLLIRSTYNCNRYRSELSYRNKAGPMTSVAATALQASPQGESGKEIIEKNKSNEIFVALVGPAGSGAGTAAKRLETFFTEQNYNAIIIKASILIKSASLAHSLAVPPDNIRKSIETITILQDRGDDFRAGRYPNGSEDHSAIARFILNQIALERAKAQGQQVRENSLVKPDGTKKVFIIDSLRHPAEVHLLRKVYQEAFALVGVVCEPSVREKRIRTNLFDRADWAKEETKNKVRIFLKRDENSEDRFGQHVSDTFEEADFFVDNSDDGSEDLSITGMNDQLKRFVELLVQRKIIRPTIAETAMHHARSAQMRSSCLSRQVGATLVDKHGNIVATGTNEVPKPGGGVYGEDFDGKELKDSRCAFRETQFCSSNKEQNNIITKLLDEFPELTKSRSKNDAIKKIRSTDIGGILEFSRAVHAEMDAILSAAIAGVSPKGCRLYVTTYPCHYCARHIVAAGIDEVQFIEPYPKSKAIDLHDDAITTEKKSWLPPSFHLPDDGEYDEEAPPPNQKVLFGPFVGVAPRMYRRVFLKDRNYKNKITGERVFEEPIWGGPLDSYKISYVEFEQKLGIGA